MQTASAVRRAFPELEADYVLWVDGGVYYCKNGHTGVVTTGTVFATLIQAAINALSNTQGGLIFVKAGNYSVTVPIVVNRTLTLAGAGRSWPGTSYQTMFTLADGANCDILQIDPAVTSEQIKVQDIHFYGNKTAQPGAGPYNGISCITSVNVYRLIELVRVKTTHCKGSGLYVYPTLRTWPDTWIIDHVSEENTVDGITLDATSKGINQWHIIGAYLGTNLRNGIRMVGGTVTNLDLTTCIILNNYEHNVYINCPTGNSILLLGNKIRGAGQAADDTYDNVHVEDSDYVSVVDTEMYDQSTRVRYAVYLLDSLYNRVSGSKIANTRRGGIVLESSSFNSVQDNVLTDVCQDANNTYDALLLTDDGANYSTNNSVIGNTIRETAGNKARYGIAENAAGDNFNTVVGNTVSGPATSIINTLGASTQRSHNVGDV